MARPRGDIEPRILHAARARFLTEGVDGASLRQIAADAETSVGMVYYYFPTKEDLFLGVVEEVYVTLLADLEQALDPARPVEARIEALYRRMGALSAGELLVVRIIVREILAFPKRLERLVERFQRGHLPYLLQLLRDGIAAGAWRPDLTPPQILVSMMLLAGPAQIIVPLLSARLGLGPMTDPARLAEQMATIFRQGVGAPAHRNSPGPRRRRAGRGPTRQTK